MTHPTRKVEFVLPTPTTILVAGPTGSGKTTSLYSGLKEISNRSQNILTIEDPVEYALEGIGQTQVKAAIEGQTGIASDYGK